MTERQSGSATQVPQQVREYLQDLTKSKNRMEFLNAFREFCTAAKVIGIPEQDLHTNLPNWYNGGSEGISDR